MSMIAKKRNTKQQTAILEELRRNRVHPTATELFEALRETMPRISLGTVYRNLENLVEEGVVNKIAASSGQASSSGQARFDAEKSDHYHVHCVKCGSVDDVVEFQSRPENWNHETKLSGYIILGYRFEFYGICPSCEGANNS